jgi:hypothetical protein
MDAVIAMDGSCSKTIVALLRIRLVQILFEAELAQLA